MMQVIHDSSQVTVSSKYQVVIPKNVRETMELEPGDTLSFIFVDGMWKVIKVPPLEKLRGFAKGMNTNFVREDEDRF